MYASGYTMQADTMHACANAHKLTSRWIITFEHTGAKQVPMCPGTQTYRNTNIDTCSCLFAQTQSGW